MNREEIIQAKDKLNHCIEFYENMCEPREVQPILTGEEKKALKSLLRYNDNLEQQCKKQQKVINKASNDLQQIMNNINDKTIISFGQFVSKLEVIQDELGGANDILKEVSE